MKTIDNPTNYIYKDDNQRYLADEDGNYVLLENDLEFLQRMKEAEDVLFIDLQRAEALLPAFLEAKTARRDIRAALEGIASGGKMKESIKAAGFAYWASFEASAMRRAPCIRRLYELAKRERENNLLSSAEEALHERAVEGIDEPIINHLGSIVGYKKKYSDSLLALQLKALDRDKYGDRKQDQFEGITVNVEMGLRDPVEKEAEGISEPAGQFAGLEAFEQDIAALSEDTPKVLRHAESE